MNILKRELRAGLKPFLFWTIGLFFLVFAGVTKFTGISAGGASVQEVFDKFPRIVMAVFGMVGVNPGVLSGYYAILAYYSFICIAIYAIALGAGAVSREASDKTYEFVFTKPRTRSLILCMKLLAGFIYLVIFAVWNYLFSVAAVATLKINDTIDKEMQLYGVAVFLVGFLFFALAAFLAAAAKRAEKGALYANMCFLVAFVLGMLYDMLEKAGFLRILTPMKYFIAKELMDGKLNMFYTGLCLVLAAVFLAAAFWLFDRKDLNAVS